MMMNQHPDNRFTQPFQEGVLNDAVPIRLIDIPLDYLPRAEDYVLYHPSSESGLSFSESERHFQSALTTSGFSGEAWRVGLSESEVVNGLREIKRDFYALSKYLDVNTSLQARALNQTALYDVPPHPLSVIELFHWSVSHRNPLLFRLLLGEVEEVLRDIFTRFDRFLDALWLCHAQRTVLEGWLLTVDREVALSVETIRQEIFPAQLLELGKQHRLRLISERGEALNQEGLDRQVMAFSQQITRHFVDILESLDDEISVSRLERRLSELKQNQLNHRYYVTATLRELYYIQQVLCPERGVTTDRNLMSFRFMNWLEQWDKEKERSDLNINLIMMGRLRDDMGPTLLEACFRYGNGWDVVLLKRYCDRFGGQFDSSTCRIEYNYWEDLEAEMNNAVSNREGEVRDREKALSLLKELECSVNRLIDLTQAKASNAWRWRRWYHGGLFRITNAKWVLNQLSRAGSAENPFPLLERYSLPWLARMVVYCKENGRHWGYDGEIYDWSMNYLGRRTIVYERVDGLRAMMQLESGGKAEPDEALVHAALERQKGELEVERQIASAARKQLIRERWRTSIKAVIHRKIRTRRLQMVIIHQDRFNNELEKNVDQMKGRLANLEQIVSRLISAQETTSGDLVNLAGRSSQPGLGNDG